MGGPMHWVTSILADVKSMQDRYPAYARISGAEIGCSHGCHSGHNAVLGLELSPREGQLKALLVAQWLGYLLQVWKLTCEIW